MSISGIGAGSTFMPVLPSTAQSAAAGAAAGGSSDASMPDPTTDPVDWLMDYSKMTPAQQMRATVLRELGLTQDQYNALSPEKKAEVDKKIEALIKQQVEMQAEKKTGMLVDVKA